MAERLYRSMKEGRDRKPEVGQSALLLGVRQGIDILVEPDGTVTGGAGGMSVAPHSPANLPPHRRPLEDLRAAGREDDEDVVLESWTS